MNSLLADCRHAVRLYVRTPGATVTAIFVLAVGMAFVGAFLSLYVDLILRPHPGFEQSGRIATIGQNAGRVLIGIPYGVVANLAGEMATIEAAAISVGSSTLVGPDREETITEMVSEEFFSGLRPRLRLGRGFRAEDHAPDAEPVVVLSHHYWQAKFGGDHNVLGTFIEISRDPSSFYQGPPGSFFGSQAEPEQETAQFRIVGVMTQRLSSLRPFEVAFWVPLERSWPLFGGVPESLPSVTSGGAYVRRPAGVSATSVASELTARYGGTDAPFNRLPGARLDAIDGIVRNIAVQRDAKRQLEMFLAGSVLLAVVAAANVSLFLLARAPGRRRELGIRMAVGAPIRRLARQLATEAGLLVVLSAALGLLISVWLSVFLRSLPFMRQAEWRDVTLLDWRVLGLAGALLLILTLLVSLAPMAGIKRLGIAASSRQMTARASLAQRIAGAAQIAVAGTLGGAAVAFGWYVGLLMFGDPGYQVSNRYLASYVHAPVPGAQESLFVALARVRDATEAIPGVTRMAFGVPVPADDVGLSPFRMRDPRDPANEIDVYRGTVSRRFVDVLGLRLVRGRAPEDDEGGVVVVNQTLARMLWGRDDVVGEHLPSPVYFGSAEVAVIGADVEVIGVLADLSFEHPAAAVKPFVFSSLAAGPLLPQAVIETSLTAAELRQELDRLTSAGMLDFDVRNVRPLHELRGALIAADRARGLLTIATAALVVLLAAFGFYGTQRYLVGAGRREYAIRASLGAGPRSIGRLVMRRGLLLGLPGLVTGGLLAFIVVAWLRGDFVSREVSPAIVTVWVCAGLTFLLLVASLGPAREAKRTQPAPLLRED